MYEIFLCFWVDFVQTNNNDTFHFTLWHCSSCINIHKKKSCRTIFIGRNARKKKKIVQQEIVWHDKNCHVTFWKKDKYFNVFSFLLYLGMNVKFYDEYLWYEVFIKRKCFKRLNLKKWVTCFPKVNWNYILRPVQFYVF